MNTENPLLAAGELPAFSAITPDHVNPAIDEVLAGFRADVARLVADPQARDFARLMAPLERWEERLGRTFSPVSHLHGVKDSPALREAYSEALEKLTEHGTELGQNRGLYAAVKALRALGREALFAASDVGQPGDAQALVDQALEQARALDKPLRFSFGRADREYKDRWCNPVPVFTV